DLRVGDEPVQLVPVDGDLVLVDQLVDGEEAVTLVGPQVGRRDRAGGVGRAPDDRVLARGEHLGGAARRVQVGDLGAGGGGRGGHETSHLLGEQRVDAVLVVVLPPGDGRVEHTDAA